MADPNIHDPVVDEPRETLEGFTARGEGTIGPGREVPDVGPA